MYKIKINNAKTYLPVSMAKGTVEQRFQKARLLNLKFYDELQDKFIGSEVAPKTFSNVLRKVAHKDISVEVVNTLKDKSCNLYHKINLKGVSAGYYLMLPFTFYNDKIHKSSARDFMQITQDFFNELFMPKIYKRNLALLDILPKGKNVVEFYEKNVASKNDLSDEVLGDFLTGLNVSKQIDVLQFLRYKLLAEQNTAKAKYQIDRRIEKHNNLEFVRNADFYDLSKYKYDEKLELISNRLKNLIKSERILNK